ncbi:uncharacterized protein LOC133662134 isoform X4 [Entelurus aequoreus]|uniref:uncharacterized protein LOC133662134 isoform X4 n=1 Tax=Entelurus aequoreus TaxID=161455 RepID=UPI002B1D6D6E|nr:uncharacterized protein LOC133662134 isoform X4 [Entelurus aequoreus]
MRAEMEGAVDGDRATSERRPSILLLQNMLRKASQSSLDNEYQTLVSSPSELSVSPVGGWRSKQNAFKTENNQPVPASVEIKESTLFARSSQNVASSNPFYSYYMESENKYKQDQDSIFVPQPQFQSSPLENEATMSDPHKDFIQAFSLNHVQDSFPTSQSVSSSGHYHGANHNSVDTYTKNLPENLYKDSNSYSSNMQDLFQNSREDEKVLAKYPSTLANPSPDKDLFTSSKDPVLNLFYSASTKFQTNGGGFSHNNKLADSGLSGSDLDAFSPFSTAEPFPSPLVKNLFGDGGNASNSFGAKPFDSKDNFRSSPLVQSNYSDAQHEIVLTTPQGSKHGILHPTPFNQAQKLMGSPDSSPTESEHVQFSRRPPKPLPRSKPSRPPKPAYSVEPDAAVPPKPPPRPFKPLPKLPIHLKTDADDNKAAESDDHPVFEDIFLMGQERCVEDWPEDSPQLDPDFKPSGKFKLRRESLRVNMDHEIAERGSGEDQDDYGTQGKKKGRKFSLMSRRGSKDTFPGDNRSFTLPTQSKSSQDYFYDMYSSPVEKEDGVQSWSDTKKKDPLKNKVNQLLRRASTSLINKQSTAESKDDDFIKKKMQMEEPTNTWHSQEAMLDDSMNVEEKVGQWESDGYTSNGKKKKKFKLISKKNVPGEQSKGAYGFSNRTDSNQYIFEDEDRLRSPHSTRQGGLVDMNAFSASMPTGLNDQELYWPEDYKTQKKSIKKKLLHLARHSSKEDMLNTNKQYYEELNSDDSKPKKNKFKASVPPPVQFRKQKPIHSLPELEEPGAYSHASSAEASYLDHWPGEDDVMRSGNPRWSTKVDYNYEVDELAICKLKKSKRKSLLKHKSKNKEWDDASEDLAALSEAAHAEMLAAQRDIANSVEDTEGDGDTDSLMEWWNTVEQWDELPSDEEEKNDDSTSFSILANKVQRGLRVFNKIFMERAEVLWQHIIRLHALADDIIIFHQKAKAAGITGGTTAAVGGVTAIAGLALAPFTFGASLIITAVGVGVATAGGITTASATISDNVNNMHERKKVEAVLQEYDLHFQDVAKVLNFVNHGIYKLRGHPFLRSGTQHYSEDWEVRKAVQMISLVDSPVMRASQVTETNLALVQRFHSSIDKYFLKESRELKRSYRKEFVAQIKEVANVLNDGVVELNAIREELQSAVGNI